MKIGIITIHYSFITRNYGSLMQLYAMQQVLEALPAAAPTAFPPTLSSPCPGNWIPAWNNPSPRLPILYAP